MKERIVRFILYLGLSGLSVSVVLLVLDLSFMKTWFYIFAWWSFIFALDSLNFRQGSTSPLYESVKDFAMLAFFSVFIWLVFELFNLRLNNWSYHGLPDSKSERWLGYFLAYATVAPALKELSIFFGNKLKGKDLTLFRLRTTSSLPHVFSFAGAAILLLPIIWPGIFFPLVWLGFVFLVDPLNFRLKNDSLLKDLGDKNWSVFWSWILAGLSAGILWELFNFWAGSHWEYSLPYFDFGRVFQMPVLGYFGFLPFALEVYAILALMFYLMKKLSGRRSLQIAIYVLLLVFYVACFMLIDRFTMIP